MSNEINIEAKQGRFHDGRLFDSNGVLRNIADCINADGSKNIRVVGQSVAVPCPILLPVPGMPAAGFTASDADYSAAQSIADIPGGVKPGTIWAHAYISAASGAQNDTLEIQFSPDGVNWMASTTLTVNGAATNWAATPVNIPSTGVNAFCRYYRTKWTKNASHTSTVICYLLAEGVRVGVGG